MPPITRAELFLRDSVPLAAATEQSRVVGRLQALASAGVIDDLAVRTWPTRVTVGDARARKEFAVCREFDAWAQDNAASLEPAFERHHCHNSFTGSDYTTTVLPVICLAMYEDDDLVALHPHTDASGIRTIGDALSALEAERTDRDVEPIEPDSASRTPSL